MPRSPSRSPSIRRRRSPSPGNHRYIGSRRSRRDRSRSPYSYRRRSPSPLPRWRDNRSPTPRRRKSRSPSPRRHKRMRSRSTTRSPVRNSQSPSARLVDGNTSIEKLRKEEEEKKRLL
ncbi:hypothetical protein AXF42_Ash008997 [Apostasia shenzhenica]|uniref:Uncharacterized protein n=1 Tax=Apostasia shenzhenica TaxID=1088818 RepID=A0A2I0AD69_9ASPA|nr:hypothetical protein AXF42_Ash008997 [Apostasia shenzhenica]